MKTPPWATHVLEEIDPEDLSGRWAPRAWGASTADVEAELVAPSTPLRPLSLWRVWALDAAEGASWFVDLDGRAVRLPTVASVLVRPEEHEGALRRLGGGDWHRAWGEGPSGAFLLDLASGAGVRPEALGPVALALARAILPLMEDPDQGRPEERRPAEALDVADAYLARRISAEELRRAADAADAASLGGYLADYVAATASVAARTVLGEGPDFAGRTAWFAVQATLKSQGGLWVSPAERAEAEAVQARFVRARLPLVAVLLALSERPA